MHSAVPGFEQEPRIYIDEVASRELCYHGPHGAEDLI